MNFRDASFQDICVVLKVVSSIKKVLSGCKSPLLSHFVSYRHQVFMILHNESDELKLHFRVRLEDYD